MNCSYCKKDMGDSDICPHCGMGRRIDYELFKSDKEERKKSFEDYEADYLKRLGHSEEKLEEFDFDKVWKNAVQKRINEFKRINEYI